MLPLGVWWATKSPLCLHPFLLTHIIPASPRLGLLSELPGTSSLARCPASEALWYVQRCWELEASLCEQAKSLFPEQLLGQRLKSRWPSGAPSAQILKT